MCTADTLAFYAVRAPLARRNVSAHVVIPLLMSRLVEKFVSLDYSSLLLLAIIVALSTDFGAIIGKRVAVDFMPSYL